jgi:rhodanese-related sulfurtransferase
MKSVNPQEAQALLAQGWTYVDVRSEVEFERGHPAGALNLPLLHSEAGGMVPNADFLKVAEAVLPKDQRLVLGCQAGGRALKAVQLLAQHGYQELALQRCGWGGSRTPTGQIEPGWAASNLPTETGHPPERSYRELAKRAP